MSTEYSTVYFQQNDMEPGDNESHDNPIPPIENHNEAIPDSQESKEKSLDKDENSLEKLEISKIPEEHKDENQMKINLEINESESHGDFIDPINFKENLSGSLKRENENVNSLKEKNKTLKETVKIDYEEYKLNYDDSSNIHKDQLSDCCITKPAESEAIRNIDKPSNCGGGDSPQNITKSESESPISTQVNLEQQEFSSNDTQNDLERQAAYHDRETDVNPEEENIYQRKYVEEDLLEVPSEDRNEQLQSLTTNETSLNEMDIVDCSEECDSGDEKQSFVSHSFSPDDERENEKEQKIKHTNKVDEESKFDEDIPKIEYPSDFPHDLEQPLSKQENISSRSPETDEGNAEQNTSCQQNDLGPEQEKVFLSTEEKERDVTANLVSEIVLKKFTNITQSLDESTEVLQTSLKEKTPEVLATSKRLDIAGIKNNPVKISEYDQKVIEQPLNHLHSNENIVESPELLISQDVLPVTNKHSEVDTGYSNEPINREKESCFTSQNCVAEDLNISCNSESKNIEVFENSYSSELNSQATESDHNAFIVDQIGNDEILPEKENFVNKTDEDNTLIAEDTLPICQVTVVKQVSNHDNHLFNEKMHIKESTCINVDFTRDDDHSKDDQQRNESEDGRSCPSLIPTISEVILEREDSISKQDLEKKLNLHLHGITSSNIENINAINSSNCESQSELSTNHEKVKQPISSTICSIEPSDIEVASNNVKQTSDPESNPHNNDSSINLDVSSEENSSVMVEGSKVAKIIGILDPNNKRHTLNRAVEKAIVEDISKIKGTLQNNTKTLEVYHDHIERSTDEESLSHHTSESTCHITDEPLSNSSQQMSCESGDQCVLVCDVASSPYVSESDSVIEKDSKHSSEHFNHHPDDDKQSLQSFSFQNSSLNAVNCTTEVKDTVDVENKKSYCSITQNLLPKSEIIFSPLSDTNNENIGNKGEESFLITSGSNSNQILFNNVHESNNSVGESSDDIALNTIIECIDRESPKENIEVVQENTGMDEIKDEKDVILNYATEQLIEDKDQSVTQTASRLLKNTENSISIEYPELNGNVTEQKSSLILSESEENILNLEPSKPIDYSLKDTNDMEEKPCTQSHLDKGVADADKLTTECCSEDLETEGKCILDRDPCLSKMDEERELEFIDESDVQLARDTSVEMTHCDHSVDSSNLNGLEMEIKEEEKMIVNTVKEEKNIDEDEIVNSKKNSSLINGGTQTDNLGEVFAQTRSKRCQPPIIVVHVEDKKTLNSRMDCSEEKEIKTVDYYQERQTSLESKKSVAKYSTLNTSSSIQRNRTSTFPEKNGISSIPEAPEWKTSTPLTSAQRGRNAAMTGGLLNRSVPLKRNQQQQQPPSLSPRVAPPPALTTIISPVSIVRRHFKGSTVSPRVTPGRDQSRATASRILQQDIPTISCPMSIASPSVGDRSHTDDTHRQASRVGVACRRLQFGSQKEEPCHHWLSCSGGGSVVPAKSPRTTPQPPSQVSCRKQNTFPKDWYPGYRFYIAKP